MSPLPTLGWMSSGRGRGVCSSPLLVAVSASLLPALLSPPPSPASVAAAAAAALALAARVKLGTSDMVASMESRGKDSAGGSPQCSTMKSDPSLNFWKRSACQHQWRQGHRVAPKAPRPHHTAWRRATPVPPSQLASTRAVVRGSFLALAA